MGAGIDLKCKGCGYRIHAMLGIGMTYPRVCDAILQDMKAGKHGTLFQAAANSDPHAAVCTDSELMRCEACGNLETKRILSLCVPIGEYKPRTGRFSSACSGEGMEYVMSYELGKTYREVASTRQVCSRCGSLMKKPEDPDKLPCPRCGKLLVQELDLLWD